MRLEVSHTPTGLKGAPAPGHTGYGAELRWSQMVLSTAGPYEAEAGDAKVHAQCAASPLQMRCGSSEAMLLIYED